uniref:Uncharacterized protein n=1 Tax=Aggregatibacter actinomycetemcomitans TaxID=714 RepID=S4W8V3_AGGAC|nr:hypothetical protein pS23A_0001 [Aggregatibacter actinomycetemcomitans]
MYFCAVNVLLPKKRTILPNPLFVLKLSIFNVKKSLSVSYSNLVPISSGIAGNTEYNFPLMKYAKPLRKAMTNIIGMGNTADCGLCYHAFKKRFTTDCIF